MSDLINVSKDGETIPVHPSLLDAHFSLGWVLAPKADPLDHDGDARKDGSLPHGTQVAPSVDGQPTVAAALATQAEPAKIGTDSGDQFSDEQLRDLITKVTGKAPHHKLGRDKLIAQFNELNAKAAEDAAGAIAP